VHHRVFGRFRSATRGMMRANFAWLAAIVFLPLPTVLIVGTTREDRLGVVIYIGTILVASACLAIVSELAHHADVELEPDAGDRSAASHRRRRWTPPALLAVALVLAAAIPGVGTAALLVLLLAIPIQRLGRRRARRSSRAEPRG
jgi:uncharacterized membrane protein